ncbi:MAG TPA: hypothetical protein HPQ00_17385, partial [Magnetococcales bacterium]|nr:hypothetical protein [Magnetococcales bacterium]
MKHRPKPTMPWKALFFGAGILLLALVPAWSSASSEKNAQSYQLKLNKTLKSLNDENKKLQIQQGMEKGLLDELELLDKQ